HVRLEDEKAAVDPAGAGGRLLGERADLVAVEIEAAEAGRRMDGGDRGELAVTPMKRHQIADVDVRQAVAVGGQKGFAADVVAQPADATARHGVESRVDGPDVPVGGRGPDHVPFAAAQVQVP